MNRYEAVSKAVKNKHSLPGSLKSWVLDLYEDPAPNNSHISGLSRKDLTSSLWADVHRIVRSSGKGLLDSVIKAAKKNPENQELAAIAAIASDIFTALKSQYDAAEKVERNFKQSFRLRYTGSNPATAAQIAWKDARYKELHNDEAVTKARQETKDTLTNPANVTNGLHNDKSIELVRISKKIAGYSFVAQYGLFELSDLSLKQNLQDFVIVSVDGAEDIARIIDKLNIAPYEAGLSGIEQSEMKRKLADHARQAQVYDVVEKLLLGSNSLESALRFMEKLEVSEKAEIRTGREMGAIMGAVGYVLQDKGLITISNKLSLAQSKDELNAILEEPAYRTAIEAISNINIADIETSKQKPMQQAIALVEQVQELDVRAKSAVRHTAKKTQIQRG